MGDGAAPISEEMSKAAMRVAETHDDIDCETFKLFVGAEVAAADALHPFCAAAGVPGLPRVAATDGRRAGGGRHAAAEGARRDSGEADTQAASNDGAGPAGACRELNDAAKAQRALLYWHEMRLARRRCV